MVEQAPPTIEDQKLTRFLFSNRFPKKTFDFPYTVKYTAQVGKYPNIIGPSPRYIPRSPSSRHMILAVPTMPEYTGCARGVFDRPLKPPCACNLVLITSNGQVTTPDMNPAVAPANAAKLSSDLPLHQSSKGVIGPLLFLWKLSGFLENDCVEVGEEATNS